MRFSGTRIMAMAHNDGNSTRYYRSGTLNADGTIAWNAAQSAIGPADATWQPLDALVANGKPVMWRADELGAGTFWIGTALNALTWSKTATDAAALAPATVGGFSSGAIDPTGGPDLNDLIVLRATSSTPLTAGSHRLVALK